jgi:hypothetical protein
VTGSGEAATDTLGRAATKVERAQAAASRVTGVPAAPPPANAEAMEALNNLAREQAVRDRLARFKAGSL